MTVFVLPEGAELDLNIFIKGMIDDTEITMVIKLSGMDRFSSEVNDTLEIGHIIEAYKLAELGTDWRAATREEIATYKKEQKEDKDKENSFSMSLDDIEAGC